MESDSKPKGLMKLFKRENNIEEEVMQTLEESQAQGEIKEESKMLINSIFEFDDKLAYEIMTPRTDVLSIDVDDECDEYLEDLISLKHSRIPVYEGDSDNIIGILHIKDFLLKCYLDKSDSCDIRPLLRKPYFVPETKNIDKLFFEMQEQKQQMSILIDEYGGFSGIVTIEDIIEEIVGDIDDEYDDEEEVIVKVDDSTFIADGDVSLDDLNDELDISLESENSETIGGFIIDILGEIPDEEDVDRIVEFENYVFKILSVADRRIERVEIKINE